jgi:Protein of unknown function (DUF3352)
MLRRRTPHGSLLTLVALLAALLLAACGSDDADTVAAGPGPAVVAPPAAIVYAEALVRPSGDAEEGVRAALRKTFRVDDPGAELRRLIDEGLAKSDLGWRPTFAEDVDPWLGDRIGVFALADGIEEQDPNAAFAFAVRDRDALDEQLERLRDEGELRAGGSVAGAEYDVTDRDEPVGVIGDYLVFASSEASFRAAATASSGESLADTSRYEDAVDEVADDALAFLYLDPRAFADALGGIGDPSAQTRETLARLEQADPVVASLTATADEIVVEATADNAVADIAIAESDADVTVGQLPGDAWLALATPPLGPVVEQVLDATGSREVAARLLRRATGLDLDSDLLHPLGGLGLFVRGSNPLAIGAGALLQLTDAAAAERLMTQIQALVGAGLGVPQRSIELGGARGFEVAIPQSPQPIIVVQEDDRIAAGYAASSVRDLLDPSQRFDESSTGSAAIATLGEDFVPSFVLIVPPLARLLRSLDQLQVADLSDVIPYVEAYESLAVGTKRDDDETTVRAVATLR